MANSNDILTPLATDKVTALEQLYEIQSKHAPSNVILPFVNNIYDINLNTRRIDAPTFLSVGRDHRAEVIYFRINRYFDYMDLSNTICVIEYIVPGDKSRIPHLYIVPFYDTSTYAGDGKMLFPWVVGGAATSQPGTLEYAVRFYKIEGEGKERKIVYNLSTQPASSSILIPLEVDTEEMKREYDIPVERYEELIYQLQNNKTTWMVL